MSDKTMSEKPEMTRQVDHQNMVFCPECQSMLWPKEIVPDENESGKRELYNYCRKCMYMEKSNRIMIATHISSNVQKIPLGTSLYRGTDKINDVTLVRTAQVICPNKNCLSNKNSKLREVVLIKDPETLRVTYMCAVSDCRHEWVDS